MLDRSPTNSKQKRLDITRILFRRPLNHKVLTLTVRGYQNYCFLALADVYFYVGRAYNYLWNICPRKVNPYQRKNKF